MIVRTLPRPAQPSPTVIHLSLYLLDTVAPTHTHKVIARQSQLQYYAAVSLCRGDASGNGVAVAISAGQLLNHHEPSLQADTNSFSLTQYKYELSCPPGEGSFPRLVLYRFSSLIFFEDTQDADGWASRMSKGSIARSSKLRERSKCKFGQDRPQTKLQRLPKTRNVGNDSGVL